MELADAVFFELVDASVAEAEESFPASDEEPVAPSVDSVAAFAVSPPAVSPPDWAELEASEVPAAAVPATAVPEPELSEPELPPPEAFAAIIFVCFPLSAATASGGERSDTKLRIVAIVVFI